jgi:hypothetical protein
VNTVQCTEIRKCSIQRFGWKQRGNFLRSEYPCAHKSLQSTLPDSASGNVDHLRRWIAGQDFYAAFSQETRVYASAAPDLQGAVASVKSLREFAPHRGALGPADA